MNYTACIVYIPYRSGNGSNIINAISETVDVATSEPEQTRLFFFVVAVLLMHDRFMFTYRETCVCIYV